MNMIERLREGMKRRDSAVISEYDADFYKKIGDSKQSYTDVTGVTKSVNKKKSYASTGAEGKKRGAKKKSESKKPCKGFEVREEGKYLDAVEKAQVLSGNVRKPGYYSQTEFQEALESDKDAILHGVEKYICKDCGEEDTIYCEVGIEDSNCKPSPYEIKCSHCGGVMFEKDYCHELKKVIRVKEGMRYFADFPEFERGQLVVKVSKSSNEEEVI